MTPEVFNFVKSLSLSGKTLDLGSMDINGNVRGLFADYTGVDMRPGRNVDLVAMANHLPFANGEFNNVLCLEMLEHDPDPFGSVTEMARVLRTEGCMVITVPSIGFPRHDYPSDYWRFTGEGIRILMNGLVEVKISEDRDHVYASAKKK